MKTNITRKYFESMSDFENWNDATEDKDNIVTIIEEGGWYRVDLTTYCARPSTAIRRLFAQLRDIKDFTGWEECMIESIQSNYWHMNDMTMGDGSKNPYPSYSWGVEQLWEKTEESPAYWYVFINIMTDAERERVEAQQKAKQEEEQTEAMPTWSEAEHNRKEQRGEYDYHQAILEDVIEYIRDEVDASEYEDRDALEEALNDELWTVDSVTGNGSGSYTFDRAKAREYVTGNLDLVQEMASDFCVDNAELDKHFVEDDCEWFDVSIRCNLLSWAIGYALDWLESDDRRHPIQYGVGVAVAF